MKYYKLLVFLFLFGCNESPKETVEKEKTAEKENSVEIDFENFPKIWQRLTKIDNQMTLYYPCTGGDRSIQCTKLSDGSTLMHLNYDGKYHDLLFQEISKKGNNSIIKTLNRKSNEIWLFELENYNPKKDTIYWNWVDNGQKHRYLYTPFNSMDKFPVIYQPCKECQDIPCDDIEVKSGPYEASLPYQLSLDGNDYREMKFTINKDSVSILEIFYYPENDNEKEESIKYTGKAIIDSTYFTIEFENFNEEILMYFNPKNEPELEYLNDTIFRFNKQVDGLIIDDTFCRNWEKMKYKN